MTRADGLLVLALVATVLLVGVLVDRWLDLPTAGLRLALAVAAGALLAAQLASHRVLKHRLVRLSNQQDGLQTLVGLYHVLPFRAPLPVLDAWSATPDLLALIADLIAEHRPGCVVECGSGTSTLVAAYALQANDAGRIVSLDHEDRFASRTRDLLRRHALENTADVRYAPLTSISQAGDATVWYDPSAWDDLTDIDLLVVDGPPTFENGEARFPALPLLYDRLAPGAVVVVDDADRPGEQAVVQRWREQFPDLDVTHLPLTKGAYVMRKPDSA